MRLVTAKHLSSIAAALVLAGPARVCADRSRSASWCESETGVTADQRIDGCSAVIKAGREKGDKLAEVFNNRGVAYRVKGDHDRAIQDYGQAIKLNHQICRRLQQPRRRLRSQRRLRPRHCRTTSRRSSSSRRRRRPTSIAATRTSARASTTSAIDDYNQAIKLKPDFAAAFDNRCWARAVVGILQAGAGRLQRGAPT